MNAVKFTYNTKTGEVDNIEYLGDNISKNSMVRRDGYSFAHLRHDKYKQNYIISFVIDLSNKSLVNKEYIGQMSRIGVNLSDILNKYNEQ
jgi:hypothetical protein